MKEMYVLEKFYTRAAIRRCIDDIHRVYCNAVDSGRTDDIPLLREAIQLIINVARDNPDGKWVPMLGFDDRDTFIFAIRAYLGDKPDKVLYKAVKALVEDDKDWWDYEAGVADLDLCNELGIYLNFVG